MNEPNNLKKSDYDEDSFDQLFSSLVVINQRLNDYEQPFVTSDPDDESNPLFAPVFISEEGTYALGEITSQEIYENGHEHASPSHQWLIAVKGSASIEIAEKLVVIDSRGVEGKVYTYVAPNKGFIARSMTSGAKVLCVVCSEEKFDDG
jgi:hypothetical protein